MSEKTCKHCNEPKPETEFGIDRSKPDERAIYCKACNVDKNRQQRANEKGIIYLTPARKYANIRASKRVARATNSDNPKPQPD